MVIGVVLAVLSTIDQIDGIGGASEKLTAFGVRLQHKVPAERGRGFVAVHGERNIAFVEVLHVLGHAEPDLLEVALATGAAGHFADSPESGEEDGGQETHDRHYDEELNEGESFADCQNNGTLLAAPKRLSLWKTC